MPRVSVVVPSYNHARFLERRLQSVFAQTFTDFEVLLLDDGSTDGSVEILRRFAHEPRVVRLDLNPVNSGSVFRQWNRGVAAARGEYVWIAETDDDADPGLLAALVAVLDAHPAVGLAYCQSVEVDYAGRPVRNMAEHTEDLEPGRWQQDFVANGREECARYLVRKSTIPNASAVVFRRGLYEAAGGADETFTLAGDLMLWVKILLRSEVAFVARPLNHFRQHARSARWRRLTAWLTERPRVTAFIAAQLPVPAEMLREARARMLREWVWALAQAPEPLPADALWECIRAVDGPWLDPRAEPAARQLQLLLDLQSALLAEIHRMRDTLGWQTGERARRFAPQLFPPGSRRARLWQALLRAARRVLPA
jgi:hypothetical protein